jgi:hypothetical protein
VITTSLPPAAGGSGSPGAGGPPGGEEAEVVGGDHVVAVAGDDFVVAESGADEVVAAQAKDDVVAVPGNDDVRTWGAAEDVVAGGADDGAGWVGAWIFFLGAGRLDQQQGGEEREQGAQDHCAFAHGKPPNLSDSWADATLRREGAKIKTIREACGIQVVLFVRLTVAG